MLYSSRGNQLDYEEAYNLLGKIIILMTFLFYFKCYPVKVNADVKLFSKKAPYMPRAGEMYIYAPEFDSK